MERKYSLAQHTVPLWRPPEMIYNAYQLGFDMVSIRGIAQGVPGEVYFDLVHDANLFHLTEKAMEETGISIHDMDLIAIREDTDIRSYEADLEAAAKLNVEGVVSSIWTPNTDKYTEKFAQLCDLAAIYGMTVNLEFVTWAEVTNLTGAKALLETVKKENARILVDTLHWHRSRVKLSDLEGCLPQWFDLVHVCDIAADMPPTKEELARTGRQERLYPGEGAADIRNIVGHIRKEAVIALEIPNRQRLEDFGAYEYARRCFETSKSYFAEG
ncbi:sugar phosphate isomerase/epimerase family protein [Hominifimenecus sp. rT4P-3]|uniref:sugar phosphate isomerase/epimerase family protein n=1 Tax=Hominifimenecus sp. rT4P-3 TaxID=3242979 RepID=UPI003DA49077